MTYSTDTSGNVAVDYVWGNLPLQPNDKRSSYYGEWLGDGDSQNIAATQYNDFPGYQPNVRTTYFDGDPIYNYPANGLYDSNSNWANCATFKSRIEFLRTVGVDPAILKDFTFSGGNNPWDYTSEGATPNFDGVVLYSYVPKDAIVYYDPTTAQMITGADLEGKVAWSPDSYWTEDVIGSWYYHAFVVFSTDPLKNTWNWY
jgi:hypothetical protein